MRQFCISLGGNTEKYIIFLLHIYLAMTTFESFTIFFFHKDLFGSTKGRGGNLMEGGGREEGDFN
jgi:hypothetical protein